MKEYYFDFGDTDVEVIAVLKAISQVSARMTKNMTIFAKQRQSKEYAIQQAISGKEWTGWKLFEGRSNRKYSNKAVMLYHNC